MLAKRDRTMHSRITVGCLAAACAFFSVATSARAAVTLIKDGQALARIYTIGPLPDPEGVTPPPKRGRITIDDALEARKLAARELDYHLSKMGGAAMPIVVTDDPTSIKGPAIVLGDLAVKLGATPKTASPNKEGFRLLTKGDQVLIGGESDRAMLFGVYELLQKLGCEWVMPGEIGEIIPKSPTVTVPDLDESQAPDFEFRRLWYRGYPQPRLPAEASRMAQWLRRQKGASSDHPAAGTGGHVWGSFIERHQKEFDADPTMLALRRAPDGTMKRMGPQLESTHPRVIELFAQEIKDTFTKNNWPKDTVAGFGIGPADGLGYSQSAESIMAASGRHDPIMGDLDRTDLLILLGNEILKRVLPEYPNVHVGFYLYSLHADYPMRYKPHPNISIIFAPINFSRFNSILDENSKSQTYNREVVKLWGKLHAEQGNWLTYRGYNWNLAENMLPFSKLRIWGDELPFYKQIGVQGLNVEATKQWSVLGPSDFVFMKLAWNTNQDWKKLLHTYCEKAFGAGAAPLERYLLRQTATQHEKGQESGSYHAFQLLYDDAFVAAAERDFKEATELAKTDGDKTRIAYIASGVEALKLYLAYHKASLNFDFPETKRTYDAMVAHWQNTYDTNTDLVANEAPAYLKRFLLQFVDQGLKYSSGENKMIYRIPDELPTMLDPNVVGDRMNFQSPTLNDSSYFKTKTYSTTWDAQGMTGMRAGAVWYRVHFTLQPDVKDKPVSLFLGGMEDEARVWINGQLIGTSGNGFSRPAVFDLTDGVKYEGDNVLAIQVVRNSAANEIGVGGLLRPSFIFTGPRLPTKAPKPLVLKPVLPGGDGG